MKTDANANPRNQVYLECLKWSVQALTLSAQEPLKLYPDFVSKTDELALDFAEALLVAKGNLKHLLSPTQLQALDLLETKLSSMSLNGPNFSEELWSDEALSTDHHWVDVREISSDVLLIFGWPLESPPQDPRRRGGVYVRG